MDVHSCVSSAIEWFRARPADVTRFISTQSGIVDEIFRPDRVFDATLRQNIQVALQRLISWQNHSTNQIFWFGLRPHSVPPDNTYPDGQFNLESYVNQYSISIFTSTTQPRRDNNDRLSMWTPRRPRRFQYEIFAYRGIDVNEVLGERVLEQYRNQREIAFPGGVRQEMIRSAREYEGGHIVRNWRNTRFDNTVIPADHRPALALLPRARYLVGINMDYPGPGDRPPAQVLHAESDDPDSPAEGPEEGDWVEDEFYSDTSVPLTGIASVPHPLNSNQAWFFCGNRYAFVKDVDATDTLVREPTAIVDAWPSLWKAGFAGGVDAVLPNPNNKQEMYFFSGDQYACINTMPGTSSSDYIVKGPLKIIDGWPSLRKVEFITIDAVLASPVKGDEAWFFSGEEYVYLKWKPGRNDDVVLGGPKLIVDGWASLQKAGLKTVDSILPNPANSSEAWVFSGEKFVRINLTADSIVSGPWLISTNWPSLHQAGFY